MCECERECVWVCERVSVSVCEHVCECVNARWERVWFLYSVALEEEVMAGAMGSPGPGESIQGGKGRHGGAQGEGRKRRRAGDRMRVVEVGSHRRVWF